MKTIVNSLGLVLTIIGVYGVYYNSPINTNSVDGGSPDDNMNKQENKTRSRNLFLQVYVWIVIFGTFLQLLSNFIPDN